MILDTPIPRLHPRCNVFMRLMTREMQRTGARQMDEDNCSDFVLWAVVNDAAEAFEIAFLCGNRNVFSWNAFYLSRVAMYSRSRAIIESMVQKGLFAIKNSELVLAIIECNFRKARRFIVPENRFLVLEIRELISLCIVCSCDDILDLLLCHRKKQNVVSIM